MKEEYFEPYGSSVCSEKIETCYVCGEPGSFSVSALTKSEDNAMRIAHMFNYSLGLHAKLVPNQGIPDIRLGACDKHIPNLRKLEAEHEDKNTISLASIVKSLI